VSTQDLDELERLKSGEAAAPIDLDELERRAKGTDGMLLMSETVLTLIAAARERDALLKVVEAAKAWEAEELLLSENDVWSSSEHDDASEALLLALAQHRGEADRGDG
jgi:hypothetical protein